MHIEDLRMSEIEGDDRQLQEQGEPQTYEDIAALYGVIDDTPLLAPNKIANKVTRLKWIKNSILALQEVEKELKDEIAVYMKDKSTLVNADGEIILTWKQSMPVEYFDAKLFRLEQKELYQRYVSQREGSRRFLIK